MGRLRRRASEPSRLLRAVRLLILSRSSSSQPILVKTRLMRELFRGSSLSAPGETDARFLRLLMILHDTLDFVFRTQNDWRHLVQILRLYLEHSAVTGATQPARLLDQKRQRIGFVNQSQSPRRFLTVLRKQQQSTAQ